MNTKTVAIASDHAGVALKQQLKEELQAKGLEVIDCGTHHSDSVDYPDFAQKLAQTIKKHEAERGILICGTGIGISIAVNRYPFIRAALCHNAELATLAREHNDANVLVLGARVVSEETAKECLDAFLQTEFAGGRHAGRVAKLSEME